MPSATRATPAGILPRIRVAPANPVEFHRAVLHPKPAIRGGDSLVPPIDQTTAAMSGQRTPSGAATSRRMVVPERLSHADDTWWTNLDCPRPIASNCGHPVHERVVTGAPSGKTAPQSNREVIAIIRSVLFASRMPDILRVSTIIGAARPRMALA